MSGQSYMYFREMTSKELQVLLARLPDDAVIQIPSINREPGQFIGADHVFYDPRENTICIDGDISEAKKEI